ncbi:MAG: hypothetical protein CMJ83_02435 [Planctomycetes bacterium]|nr:hypothetical protein [Planctomycetota bacterium]
MSYRQAAALALAALVLCGCQAALDGYPDSSHDAPTELAALGNYYSPKWIKENYYDTGPDAAKRNEILNGRIRAIDIHFNAFRQDLHRQGLRLNIGIEWAVLGINAAGTFVGGSSTKAILHAIATGLQGGKATFDKHAFFDEAMPAVLAKMTSRRKEVLVSLRTRMGTNLASYSLHEGLIDIEDYYTAGTIPGALIDITETSGQKAKAAEAKMEVVFELRGQAVIDTQSRTQVLLDRVDQLDDAKAISVIQNLPIGIDGPLKAAIAARDPEATRFTDGAAAKAILKMVIALRKDLADVKKMEAALLDQ